MKDKIFGVKGFNKDMTCRGMQYEEGKTYKMDEAPECCNNGYHFCENPVDCLGYYSPADSVYHKVEATGDISRDDNSKDTKIATNEIKIGAKIDFQTMVKLAIDFTLSHCKKSSKKSASKSEDRSIASNTGYSSVASNTGYRSVASNTGYSSVASNTGYSSVASNTGDRSVAKTTGESCISCNLGIEGKASGKKGSWIIVVEWERDDECNWYPKNVKSVKVDGKKVKEDTLYALENGKLVEKE